MKSNGKPRLRRFLVTVAVQQYMEVSAPDAEQARVRATREMPTAFGTIGRSATITDVEELEPS